MFDNVILEPEQKELLVILVESARKLPRDKRQKFYVLPPALFETTVVLNHPGLPNDTFEAYPGDIEALSRIGLLFITYEQRLQCFDVSPQGYAYYQYLKQQIQRPIKRISDEIKSDSNGKMSMKKKLTFQTPSQLPTLGTSIGWIFPFTMVDSLLIGQPEERSRTYPHTIKVTATYSLILAWGFPIINVSSEQATLINTNLKKILFEYGKRYIEDKLRKIGTLEQEEKLALTNYNSETPCPYDPARINDPDGVVVEVDIRSDIPNRKQLDIEAEFVDGNRITELEAVPVDKYDLTKLKRLCEELNICYSNDCYLAVAMLTRALIDHIPPIFGFNKFAEVVNNYDGSKSFKEHMDHLQSSSRKIADAHLHTPIRSKESLPTKVQVNFANDIDVLLAEIIRILK